MAVSQGETRRQLGDRRGLTDSGRTDDGNNAATFEDIAIADVDLICQQVQRLIPGLLQVFDITDSLGQAAREFGTQAQCHQTGQELLRMRGALTKVVPTQSAEFGGHPTP